MGPQITWLTEFTPAKLQTKNKYTTMPINK